MTVLCQYENELITVGFVESITKMVRIKSMPADGDCLFWALGYFYDISGPRLRQMLINHMKTNRNIKLNGIDFSDWIQWSEEISYDQYIRKLERGMWGGYIEMALFNTITGSAITVWEPYQKNGIKYIKKISSIQGDEKPHCHIVYMNRNHYGVLY